MGGRDNITFMTFCRQGYLCLPYMALQQHHLLSDVTVRGFVAGATNILFRQQRHLTDAIIDVSPEDLKVETHIHFSLVLTSEFHHRSTKPASRFRTLSSGRSLA